MFDFGFKRVGEEEKKGLVSRVFNSVAGRYDLMNNVMSLGLQGGWKRNFADMVGFKAGDSVLDLACGSGDISALLLEKEPSLNITLADPTENMLELARRRFEHRAHLKFVQTYGENLLESGLCEGGFDSVVISFGIRNFANIPASLEQIYRVLKPEGSLYVLEFFSDLASNPLYKFYLLNVIPKMGAVVLKDEESYRYFGESIVKFYKDEEFVNLLEKGLQNSKFRLFNKINVCFGVAAALHFKKI